MAVKFNEIQRQNRRINGKILLVKWSNRNDEQKEERDYKKDSYKKKFGKDEN